MKAYYLSLTQENMFERDSVEPLDHFDGNYSPAQVVGTCNQCEGDDIHVSQVLCLLVPPASVVTNQLARLNDGSGE